MGKGISNKQTVPVLKERKRFTLVFITGFHKLKKPLLEIAKIFVKFFNTYLMQVESFPRKIKRKLTVCIFYYFYILICQMMEHGAYE